MEGVNANTVAEELLNWRLGDIGEVSMMREFK